MEPRQSNYAPLQLLLIARINELMGELGLAPLGTKEAEEETKT